MIFLKFIAHRGLRTKEAKENTIKAFQNAIDSPVMSGFELDIRQTKDKQFMVNHNAFIKNDLIRSKKSKYLKCKYNLPFLEEVLALETDKIILIEIKDITINYRKFVKLVNQFENKNIYIMSFHNRVISKLKKYPIKAKLGILNYILNDEEEYDYDFICLLNNLSTEEIIECYQKKKIEVFMYGVINEEKDLFYEDTFYILDKEPTKTEEKEEELDENKI